MEGDTVTLPRLADAKVQEQILAQRHGKKVRQYWDAAKNDARTYLHPLDPKPGTEGEDYRAVSVTSALGVLDKPGVLQWSLDQQAAVAVMETEKIMLQSPEKAFSWLRFAGGSVLTELQERGEHVHEFMEATISGGWPPDPETVEEQQMMEQGALFLEEHWVTNALTEVTVWSHAKEGQKNPYAGTLDLVCDLDGVPTLLDWKSAKNFQVEHIAQMAALAFADELLQEVEPLRWVRQEVPKVEQVAVVQLRPDYVDNDGEVIPAHYKLTAIPVEDLGPFYDLFLGALDAKCAMTEAKSYYKKLLAEGEQA